MRLLAYKQKPKAGIYVDYRIENYLRMTIADFYLMSFRRNVFYAN